MRQGTRIVLGVGLDLGERDVTGRVDELAELIVGDRGAIDPEAVDRDAMRWSLFGVVLVRSHAEGAPGDPRHLRALAHRTSELIGAFCHDASGCSLLRRTDRP